MQRKPLKPADAAFIQLESRENMMHVGGLMYFKSTDVAPWSVLSEAVRNVKSAPPFQPPWTYRLERPDRAKWFSHHWIEETKMDIHYHVRRSALPQPAGERELGVLVSRLHGNAVDLDRPPWELQIIENLPGDRMALYTKMHHSLIDGVSAMRLLAESMSTDPNDLDTTLFLCRERNRGKRDVMPGSGNAIELVNRLSQVLSKRLDTTMDVGKGLAQTLKAIRNKDEDLVTPYRAPRSMFNGRIGRARRFATQSYELGRLKAIARKIDGSLNDVVLAICAGSLRRFLVELEALPDKPLIAMLPVSTKEKGDKELGNAVGLCLANLATDEADPEQRIRTILASTKRAKQHLRSMSNKAIEEYSMFLATPYMFQMVSGRAGKARPPFNVTISNVPGPKEALYFRGVLLDKTYPVSIPTHGQALNITCQSYNGWLNFGFIGCRETIPSLQRIAVYCEDALAELERVVL